MDQKNYILSKAVAEKKIRRMALEVVERNYDAQVLLLIGIRENGIVIAHKMATALAGVFAGEVRVLELLMDKKRPEIITILPETDFTGAHLLLIDDVANTGHTMLYALKPLLNFFPANIQTLALVERTHKTFPIHMDYVGLSVSTTPDQHIYVEVIDGDLGGAYLG